MDIYFFVKCWKVSGSANF